MLYTGDDTTDAIDPIRRLAVHLYGPCEVDYSGDGKIDINPEDPSMPPETVSLPAFLERLADKFETVGSNKPKPT